MSIAFIDEIKVTSRESETFRGVVVMRGVRRWEVTLSMTVYAQTPEEAQLEAYFAILPHVVQVPALPAPSSPGHEDLSQSTWPGKESERTGH